MEIRNSIIMRTLLFFLFYLSSFAAAVQPLHYFTHFTEKDGLSDNRVQCILRDNLGFLWVGTANGLNRFDGYSFRKYFPDAHQPLHTISNEFITDIKQDNNGFIWIATHDGLNCYNPRTEVFKAWQNTGHTKESLPNGFIWNILIDKNNTLWLVCDNRNLTHFDPNTGIFTTFPWKNFLQKAIPQAALSDYQTIYYLLPKGADELWLETNFGLFSFNPKTEIFNYHPKPTDGFSADKDIHCEQTVYLGSLDSDLLRYNPCNEKWSQIRLPFPPADLLGDKRYVTSAFLFKNNYWVLSRNGLFLLDADADTEQKMPIIPNTQNRFSAPTGLLQNFFVEKTGTIWLGGEEGLWLYEPAAQHFYYTALKKEDSKEFDNTFHHFTDSKVDGRRYLLDYFSEQLQVFEKGKLLKTLTLSGKAALLYEDAQKTLWVGGGSQLFQLNRQSLTLKPFSIPDTLLNKPTHSIFVDMLQDAEGNFWFANNKEGVLVWKPHKKKWWKPSAKEGFLSFSPAAFFADTTQQSIWIATQDYGLYRYDERNHQFILYQKEDTNPTHSLGAYITNAVCKDGQGYIWAATDPGGISRFDYDAPIDKAFITLNMENGLPSNQVFSLVADDSGNIWAGTSKGLAWVDSHTLRVRSFGKNNGMVTDYLNLPLSLAANGEIISGTPFGYQHFFPKNLLKETLPTNILLTAFKIFDDNYTDSLNINFLKKIQLTWQQNFFSFEFASTHFSSASKNEYAYRLKGFDTDWNFVKNRHQASYTNVPPGNYILEIKSGREGIWSESGLQLELCILPPFWATWWFRSLLALVIVGSSWAFYQWRISLIQQEEALKTAINQRIARIEMTALRSQMNPHFIFNCLSSINRFILVNQPDEASAYLTKFSRLIRLILDNSRMDTIPLNREIDALQLYIEMEQMRFSNHFDYDLQIHKTIQTELIEIPPLLIQPFVENAIWHGLMHKKKTGLLQIKVFPLDSGLCIEIEDNGIGRQRAMELKSRSATTHKSLGMKVTSERLEVINQLYDSNAQIETEDLKDEKGAAIGTKVRIYL